MNKKINTCKNEKNPVGRPKLADKKTKKESILVCLFIFIIIGVVAILGYNMIAMEFSSKYIVGTVYNDHVNSCVIRNKIIDCGPNVTQMKYKINGEDYIDVIKEDKSIKIKLDDYKKIDLCYKTNKTDMICNK